jgi:Xaa-Pro aminopeptidase
MADKELEALLVSTPENRHYVSGFTGTAGHLLVSRDQALLATDFRYIQQAQGQAPEFQVLKVDRGWKWLFEQLSEIGANRMGFEGQHMTVATYKQLTDAVQDLPSAQRPTLISTLGLVEALRTVKDPQELALLQKAIDVSDSAMEAVTATIQPGDTEREVTWRMEKTMRELGADSISFPTIVAGGANGAMPHHRASDRPLKTGEPLVIDMGAMVDGYCSDITRTICVGEPDEKFRQVYDLVLAAQLTAIATLKPQMSGGEGDSLARDVLEEAGYGETFGHSLGHGIGLAVHEYPSLGPNSPNTLEEGMVFSVEPGIYLSGWGGVRIEDLVVLESGGARPLSKAKK